MSVTRATRLISMVLFGLLLLALLDADVDVDIAGLTVPVWVVSLVSYLLGWVATVASMIERPGDN